MIRTAIILEDEIPASERLKRLLQAEGIVVLEQLQSVKNSLIWLNSNQAPDYIFADVKLSDGESLEIFKKLKVESKIVFTTAYGQYALKAFEVNSIAYLLKPINVQDLKKVLSDISYFASIFKYDIIQKIKYQEEFIVSFGSKIKKIKSSDIIAFFSENNCTFLLNKEDRVFPLSYSLDNLETKVDNEKFFRINRSQLVNRDYILEININILLLNKKVLLKNNKISREKLKSFKIWFNRP